MKGYHMYSKIQQLRSAGFSQQQVARQLGINRKTIKTPSCAMGSPVPVA